MAPAISAPPRVNPTASAVTATLPRTRSGRIKQRLSWDEKLKVLDPTAPGEVTERRLEQFQKLFAFRLHDGIITRVGQGHRAWTKLIGSLRPDHLVRHLLGDRIPSLAPQWVGARSFETSLFACLDIDADRSDQQRLAEEHHLDRLDEDDRAWLLERKRPEPSKPSYQARCQAVEDALGRLGINPDDPREVLVRPSPSGGRHYFVFFTALVFLDQLKSLFEEAGLKFAAGAIELYPSVTNAFWLAYGHHPGGLNNPRAWIEFIDDYRSHRIKRFSPEQLYENLSTHQGSSRSNTPPPTRTPPRSAPGQIPRPSTRLQSLGLPKRLARTAAIHPAIVAAGGMARYAELVQRGPSNPAEAEELLDLGILVEGTRTAVLKHLAAHLVFIKGHTAHDAAEQLTTWAKHSRHRSKDIQSDLINGTDVVSKQIARLCEWHENKRDPDRPKAKQAPVGFAAAEIEALRQPRNDLLEQGVALLELYQQEPPPENILAVEQEITVPLVNSQGEFLDKPLVAVLDMLNREDAGLVVNEYKTSGRRFNEFEADTALQASAYAHTVQEKFDEPATIRYTVLVRTKTPAIQRLETVRSEMDRGRLGDLAEAVDKAIQIGAFYPIESPMNCSGCPFRLPCREWSGVAKPTREAVQAEESREAVLC